MTPIQHPSCNTVLKAPAGDTNCEDLHIRRTETEVWSFWKPNAEELSALILGGTVALRVCGQAHPPLSIHAAHVADLDGQNAAAYDVVAARYQTLISLVKRILSAWTKGDNTQRMKLSNEFLDFMNLPKSNTSKS